MIALAVRQPWAALIAAGLKTIEVRTWRTSHLGPLLIVSSRRADLPAGVEEIEDEASGLALKTPRGVAVCTVDLVACRPLRRADAAAAYFDPAVDLKGLLGWHFANPRAVPNIPIKGRLGLFQADLDQTAGA